MPARREWTLEEIDTLRTMTAQGISSYLAAEHFGVSPQHIREVRHRYGIELPEVFGRNRNGRFYRPPPAGPAPLSREQNWWPLPPGHPESWGAITKGTVLEGSPYA